MEAEEILKSCDEKINKPWIKNKCKFLLYGFKGEYGEIIGIIFKDIKIDMDNIEDEILNNKQALINICDNRIERLKTSTSEIGAILATVGLLIVTIAISIKELTIAISSREYLIILIFLLVLVLAILIFAILYHRAQTNAWHAVKEAALRMKESKKTEKM